MGARNYLLVCLQFAKAPHIISANGHQRVATKWEACATAAGTLLDHFNAAFPTGREQEEEMSSIFSNTTFASWCQFGLLQHVSDADDKEQLHNKLASDDTSDKFHCLQAKNIVSLQEMTLLTAQHGQSNTGGCDLDVYKASTMLLHVL